MSLEEKTRGPTLNIENIGQTSEHQDSVGGQITAGELFQKNFNLSLGFDLFIVVFQILYRKI